MLGHGIHLHPDELRPVGPIPRRFARAMDCDTCRGTGKVHKPIAAGDFAIDAIVTCPECRGTGRHQYRNERRNGDT